MHLNTLYVWDNDINLTFDLKIIQNSTLREVTLVLKWPEGMNFADALQSKGIWKAQAPHAGKLPLSTAE